ncbi:MAG: ArsR/SmtB family transcription factor [Promethearchaeota archaeon]
MNKNNNSIELKQLKTLTECKTGYIDINKYMINLKKLKNSIEQKIIFKDQIKMYKALADKNRLLIFNMLLENEEMCICEFSIALEKTQPTISHHIQKLEEADLIEGIKRGKFIHYRIKKETAEKMFQQLREILYLI